MVIREGRWRRYSPLSPTLREQLLRVEPSTDGMMEYRPSSVLLQDGRTLDRVYVQETRAYIRAWGVWPEDDAGKQSVLVEDVARIEGSPARLPAHLANKMYAAGESGIGYCLFTLILRDGRRLACVTGNAVDFVDFPPDVRPAMIVDLLPHVGREQTLKGEYLKDAPYHWCLYRQAHTDNDAPAVICPSAESPRRSNREVIGK